MIRYGSVCSGVEAASLAWESLGWTPAWFSEIDPVASGVLAYHWPDVPNLGDMLELDAEQCADIDVLVGGTPCQNKAILNHKPLGTLANAELRGWRQRAHAAFDPRWKSAPARSGRARNKSRLAHYGWLAKKLGVRYQDCHIGMFDIEQCKLVIEACG